MFGRRCRIGCGGRSSTKSPQYWRRCVMKSELVKTMHLQRRAVVYVRQSSPSQMVSHQESLRLQYALKLRAKELGWREADIDVVDTDLGLSAASTVHRDG